MQEPEACGSGRDLYHRGTAGIAICERVSPDEMYELLVDDGGAVNIKRVQNKFSLVSHIQQE